MYTRTLKKMQVGEICSIFSKDDYKSLHAARTMLRKKPEFADWNWQIKLGGQKVSIKRTT